MQPFLCQTVQSCYNSLFFHKYLKNQRLARLNALAGIVYAVKSDKFQRMEPEKKDSVIERNAVAQGTTFSNSFLNKLAQWQDDEDNEEPVDNTQD